MAKLKEKAKHAMHNVFKPTPFKTGLLAGLASYFPIHEGGHALATGALGGHLEYSVNKSGILAYDTTEMIYRSNSDYMAVLVAGPLANFAAAFAAAFIANRLDSKHTKLKPFLSGVSVLHSLSTGIRYVSETGVKSFGDFDAINRLSGMPPLYTGLIVGGATAGLACYALKGYFKKKRAQPF